MLSFQSRLSPSSPDVEDSNFPSHDSSQGQRGPKNLSTTFPNASIYLDHFSSRASPHSLKRVSFRQSSIMENLRLSIEKSEEMSFGCLVDHGSRLVASSFGSNSALVEKHLIEYSVKTMGKSPTRGSLWLTKEMIRRFEGSLNPK